jgi:hypothetical protein
VPIETAIQKAEVGYKVLVQIVNLLVLSLQLQSKKGESLFSKMRYKKLNSI